MEWGFTGIEEGNEPDWIEFRNETVSLGVKFRMSPTYENIDEVYSIYYILIDHNRSPKMQKYNFFVLIVDPDEEIEKYRQR